MRGGYPAAVTHRGLAHRVASRLGARARERMRRGYYAVGHDRDFPGKERVETVVRRWEAGRGDVPKDRAAWDEQYAAHGWDFLAGLGEVAHYAVIMGYASYLRPGGSVLDVGCGEGVLHERLRAVGYAHYTGVDISTVAIEALRARTANDPDSTREFVAADADEFTPSRTYDVVVFNESLTYFPDPAATFRRYLGFLAEDGVAIVSCHEQSARADAILRGLVAEHGALDETRVEQGPSSWRCAVFRP